MSYFGTIVRGVKTKLIQVNDDLEEIIVETLTKAFKEEEVKVRDRDVVAITESVLAKSQNNFVNLEQIVLDIKEKLSNEKKIGVVFPIFSRNRFSLILKAISMACDEVVLQLSYPFDEVGNPLLSLEEIESKNINKVTDSFEEEEFRKLFPNLVHPLTGVDYLNYYKEITNNKVKIILSNDPLEILKHTKTVIVGEVHNRHKTKEKLLNNKAKKVLTLDEILNKSVNGSGYNKQYGLLGSNLASDDVLKLFPRDAQAFVEKLQKRLIKTFNKQIEVMIYGDGAFKDPSSGIWELADPVVSPGFTSGLEGSPYEIKLKYLVETTFKNLKGEELEKALKELIKNKNKSQQSQMLSQGTTPRKIVDLIGSLSDLASGSGDKGTPVIYIQGYFDNYGK